MDLEVLRKIGLSPGEVKVYSALLDSGSSPINKIHEKTGIERSNIYGILNKLIARGLVSYVLENKKRFYRIAHPNRVIGYIEEKKHALDKTKKEIETDLPNMIKNFEIGKPEIAAEIYRGMEGIKSIWEDMLNYDENYFINSGRYLMMLRQNYWESLLRRRIEKKIKWHNLARFELRGKVKPTAYEYIKFLPKEFSGNPNVIFIYGNKVANVLWNTPFAFVIESKELAEDYKRYYRYLWRRVAKK